MTTTPQQAEAPKQHSPYPRNMEEAMRMLDENEAARRARGIYPDSYAGKSGKRRAAAADRYLNAMRQTTERA